MQRDGGLQCGVLALVAVALMALSYVPACAQGFMVKPMIVELTPSPGDAIRTSIEIHNNIGQTQRIQVRARELTQASGGAWQASAPENAPAGGRSALEFMEVSAEELTLAAREGGRVDLTFRVPQRARGFYGAALLINSTPPDTAPGAVAMVVQFLIPIIVQIEGRPARENIAIADLDMRFIRGGTRAVAPGQTREFPPTTEVGMVIANAGETLGRVSGELTVSGKVDDTWRQVARIDLRQRSLIPGGEFTMTSDIGRRLPSGEYRLSATMRLGGRFAGRQERIIEFEGDPEIRTLMTDVPLMMDDIVQVEAARGGTRSTSFVIENPTNDEVHVATAVDVPRGLRGVALGELDGQELSAAGWVEINPESFRLRGGTSRTVRVISRAPADLPGHPNYYADLHIGAFYPDGQSAGRWKTIVHAKVPGAESSPAAKLENILVSQVEDGYAVTAQFANVGDVHTRPSCEARLRGADAVELRAQMDSQTTIALPLAIMEWSGNLPLAGVRPGRYTLEVALLYGDRSTTGGVEVRVTEDENGEKTMTVIEESGGPAGETADAEE
ncbi:MAG: hypothetical protein ACOX9R_16625 [Armatimonadota bacterium]|jgi:hypothetical protein